MKIKTKFIISLLTAILWIIFCFIIQYPWFISLKNTLGNILAMITILGLSFLPSIMIIFLAMGVILDKPKRFNLYNDLIEDITILVAAYNEEDTIYNTIKSISEQKYPNNKIINIKVIDNNSNDNTKNEILKAIKNFNNKNINIQYMFEKTKGKFAALNKGLKLTNTKYVITIDADTLLYKDALLNIVSNMYIMNQHEKVGAIAGTVLVKNSNINLLTKIQYWEYLLSIASIKRMQGLYNSVLVAQGAFSIYNTKLIQRLGGWKDSIGEDIVLTWDILSQGYKTYYADRAIAFTNVPEKFNIFAKQRARWARGMIEGFKHFSFKNKNNGNLYYKWFIFADLFLFIIDFSVTFIYIPGLIAALLLHNYLIVGIYSLLLLPVTVIIFSIMYLSEFYRVLKFYNLKTKKYYFSFIIFLLFYSIIMSPICVWGYIQEFIGANRKWK